MGSYNGAKVSKMSELYMLSEIKKNYFFLKRRIWEPRGHPI